MAVKRRRLTASGVLAGLLGLLCALVLGALFYGTMVYQLAGERGKDAGAGARVASTPAPLAQSATVQGLFPGPLLGLDGGDAAISGETAEDVRVGGETCRVVTRSYTLADGGIARAVSAVPAAYLERLTAEGCRMQLITGFVIDGLDAVYAVEGQAGILAARDGDFVYMIEAQADEQTLYALGAAARIGEGE